MDEEKFVKQAAEIMKGILKAQSPVWCKNLTLIEKVAMNHLFWALRLHKAPLAVHQRAMLGKHGFRFEQA